MAIIDISPLISERFAVFPGDQAFHRQRQCSFAAGDHMDLSSITLSLHLGAHADAPSHYQANGQSIDQLSLNPYLGPCEVIKVKAEGRIKPADVSGLLKLTSKRVLFRTDSAVDLDVWRDDFASLSPELILELHARGVVLVGIDTPSVDPADSKLLESHQALAQTGMRVLENLRLHHVETGEYVLIAPPLKIEAAEAAPLRAVLLTKDLTDLKS